jgi:predicted membrane channel-forming protein YqfA (hemolysin III family)
MASTTQTQVKKKKKFSLKRYRIWQYILMVLAYIGLITPMICLIIKNRSTYFTTKSTISINVALIVVLIVVLTKNRTKNFGGVFWLGIGCVLSYLLKSIISDLTLIMTLAFIGSVIYTIFHKIELWCKVRADAVMTSKINAMAQNDNFEVIKDAISDLGEKINVVGRV